MSVRLDSRGDVAVMTLDRPEAMNALNADMIARIASVLDDVAVQSPAALLITGAGSKAFCAGADIREMLDRKGPAHREAIRLGQLAFAKLDALALPSVAVINGVALGGGLELAMACSFRIAAPTARLGLPEVKLGLLPGYGGTQRLPRLVGTSRALEMIASGRLVGAEEVERIGLVHRIVEMDDPVESGLAFLQSLGMPFPSSLMLARTAVEQALSLPLEQGLELEADLFGMAANSADAQEGMGAFLAKRKPVFKGNEEKAAGSKAT